MTASPTELFVRTSRHYRPVYELLRRPFVHDASLRRQLRTLKDRWDCWNRSLFIDLVDRQGRIAGTLRLTRGASLCCLRPPSHRGVIQSYTRGQSPLPYGVDVVDASRIVCPLAGRGLYGMLFLLGIEWARRFEAVTRVCAVVKSDLKEPQGTLKRLGSEQVSTESPVNSYDVPGQEVEVVFFVHDLRDNQKARACAWEYSLDKLRDHGVVLPEYCRARSKSLQLA